MTVISRGNKCNCTMRELVNEVWAPLLQLAALLRRYSTGVFFFLLRRDMDHMRALRTAGEQEWFMEVSMQRFYCSLIGHPRSLMDCRSLDAHAYLFHFSIMGMNIMGMRLYFSRKMNRLLIWNMLLIGMRNLNIIII